MTHGRSPRKPTVGRDDDLLWIVLATYRGSFFTPSEDFARSAPDSALSPRGSPLQIRRDEVLPSPANFSPPTPAVKSVKSMGGGSLGCTSLKRVIDFQYRLIYAVYEEKSPTYYNKLYICPRVTDAYNYHY